MARANRPTFPYASMHFTTSSGRAARFYKRNFMIALIVFLINCNLLSANNNRYSSYHQFHRLYNHPHDCQNPDHHHRAPPPDWTVRHGTQPETPPNLIQLRLPPNQNINILAQNQHEPNLYLIREHELNLLANRYQQSDQSIQNRHNGLLFKNQQYIVHNQQQQPLRPSQLPETFFQTTTKTITVNNELKQNKFHADIDECLDERACGRGAVCENLPGSFRCVCPPGFTGDPTVECIGK